MFRAPIWITSAVSTTASTCRGSSSSVTSGRPVSSLASARIARPASPSPWNVYGEVRGLKAPPRRTVAPAALTARAVSMLDAPVSGGTEGAKTGELSIIVGGAAETFEACRDLFKAMGTKIFHVGGIGQGLAMKLVNNMLIQVNTVAVAEALVMGVKAGLDPRTIYEVVRVSTGTSSAFERQVPKILARDFAPGGTVDVYFKDQELETAFAKQLGVPVLLANVSQQVYQMARAAGLSKQDGTAIIQVLERLAGVRVGG